MNSKWRRFAPLGLVLSGVAALAATVFYLVQNKFDLYVQISLALIVVGLALYVWIPIECGSCLRADRHVTAATQWCCRWRLLALW